jgi:small subunit ribosomal protein S18
MGFANKRSDREERSSKDSDDQTARAPRRPRGRKRCPFTGPNAPKIDYKDVRTLARYLSERGKIMPARLSGISAKNQRKLALAIKRSRFLALIPYVGDARRAANQTAS